VAIAAFLTACGGDEPADSEGSSAPAETSSESASPTTGSESGNADSGETQTITASEDDFTISLEEDNLSAGMYEITVENEGSSTHDLVVERDGQDVAGTEEIPPGESATLMVELESGDYVFYCSIGAHRSMGMEIDVSVS
jgi:plastocyanin